jgi:Tol biopolymer transport system component
VDSVGAEGNNASTAPSTSSDGRYVAFESFATNLVANDTNNKPDVFVHDRQTGFTSRVSVNSAGAEGDESSTDPSISSDGRYVAFESDATDLVAGDTNGFFDVFVHDRQTGTTTRVSVDSAGAEGIGASFDPSISSDGGYVAFESDVAFVADNANFDVYVHDRQTGATTLVSVDSFGAGGNDNSADPSISSDGRYVAFESKAIDLVPLGSNGLIHIFVHDRDTDGDEQYDEAGSISTLQVSVDSAGAQGIGGDSSSCSISGDGRYVAFVSAATNLVANDTNGSTDVFVHDLQTGKTTRVSVDSAGIEGDNNSNFPSISSDGRYVAFESAATNLVADDTNGSADIFVHDLQTGTTTRVSVDLDGVEGNDNSNAPSMSADGILITTGLLISLLTTCRREPEEVAETEIVAVDASSPPQPTGPL